MKLLALCAALSAVLTGINSAQAQALPPQSKILIAYYSRSGNTAAIANQIKQTTGGDIFEIVPVQAYPDDYRQTTEQAKKEISEGYKPELQNKVKDFAAYDIIFVGSPCWWGTVASPVASFLSEYDFSGKTVIPFMTHGGSGLGHSVEDIKKQLPNAEVTAGKAFWGSKAASAETEVKQWIEGLKND